MLLNTIKKKILAANGVMLLILLAVSVFALTALNNNQKLLAEQERATKDLDNIADMKEVFFDLKMANLEFTLLLQTDLMLRRDRLFEKARLQFSNSQIPVVAALVPQVDDYYLQIKQASRAFISDDRMLGSFVTNDSNRSANAILDVLNVEYQKQQTIVQTILGEVGKANDRVVFSLYMLFAAMLIVGVTMSLFMASKISEEVTELTETIRHIEEHGDLTMRAQARSNGEVGLLARAFNKLIVSLFNIVADVHYKGEQLVTSAGSLSDVAYNTRSGMETQSGEIEKVATAMSQMSKTVGQVADITDTASSLAESCNHESQSGSVIVKETIGVIQELANEVQESATAIDELKGHSQSIGGVLDVIKNISEQTNLLALNAAIEAARAGEQGRGFAVVADEVRTLAQRTQDSTGEIEKLVETLQKGSQNAFQMMNSSRDKASSTVQKAKEAGNSLNSITESMANMVELNAQVAQAAKQQADTAREVTQNMSNIRLVAMDTSDGVKKTSENSQKLKDVGVQLRSLVRQFKIS